MTGINELKLKQAMYWHLVYNHYPPYPAAMVETCIKAVEAVQAGQLDKEIPLPAGYQYQGRASMPASKIIEDHHLSDFVQTVEITPDKDNNSLRVDLKDGNGNPLFSREIRGAK